MFDRSLLAIDDELGILTMTHGLPEDAARVIVPDRRLRVPQRVLRNQRVLRDGSGFGSSFSTSTSVRRTLSPTAF